MVSKTNACLLGLMLTGLVCLHSHRSRSIGWSSGLVGNHAGHGGGSFPPQAMLPGLELLLLELGVWLVAGLMLLELLPLLVPSAWKPRPRVVLLGQVLLGLGLLVQAELVTGIVLWPHRCVPYMAPHAIRFWTFNRDTSHPNFTVNSHGLRGLEVHPKKSANEFRILCLGNSVSAGDNLAEKETYPFLLQAYLRKRCPGVLVRVLNGAVYGYSAVQGRMVLEEVADEFQPDLVIASFGRFEPFLVNAEAEPLPAQRGLLGSLRQAAFGSTLYLTSRQMLDSRLARDYLLQPGQGHYWLLDPQEVDRSDRNAPNGSDGFEVSSQLDQKLQTPLNNRLFWWFFQESRRRGFQLVQYSYYERDSPVLPLDFGPDFVRLRDRVRQVQRERQAPLSWDELQALLGPSGVMIPDLAYIADVPIVDLNRTWREIPNIADYMQDSNHPNVPGTVMQATDIGNFLLEQGLVPGTGREGAPEPSN